MAGNVNNIARFGLLDSMAAAPVWQGLGVTGYNTAALGVAAAAEILTLQVYTPPAGIQDAHGRVRACTWRSDRCERGRLPVLESVAERRHGVRHPRGAVRVARASMTLWTPGAAEFLLIGGGGPGFGFLQFSDGQAAADVDGSFDAAVNTISVVVDEEPAFVSNGR